MTEIYDISINIQLESETKTETKTETETESYYGHIAIHSCYIRFKYTIREFTEPQ